MKAIRCSQKLSCFLLLLLLTLAQQTVNAQTSKPVFNYSIAIANPASHAVHVELSSSGWHTDTLNLKMPAWMPGYYQLMPYAKAVSHVVAKDKAGNAIAVKHTDENTWQLQLGKQTAFTLSYDILTERKFVATSYVDSSHAYLVTTGLFLYADGFINNPVTVKVLNKPWANIATGLERIAGKTDEFMAADFDILYDCPILMGKLEELPAFTVNNIPHRFIGYQMDEFDRVQFMHNLKKVVEAAAGIIGDIPYKEYTFIGIGPGRGGIEHLNNTTVSFDGKGLNTEQGMNTTMIFLSHEYFHHYNVKRIRPVELGPFDYSKPNRTNLLWVSEGLSVYYEYLVARRAGLSSEQTFLGNFERNLNTVENNPGRLFQSLTQASYETWSDGPFGRQGKDAGKSISYYDKGPLVGLILDLAIRQSTQNKRSLDDVMRHLYFHYYKKLQRGFTDAEFQQACETIAGTTLSGVFEYVYSTKELDYNTYLNYAGLQLDTVTDANGKKKISIEHTPQAGYIQEAIFKSWSANK